MIFVLFHYCCRPDKEVLALLSIGYLTGPYTCTPFKAARKKAEIKNWTASKELVQQSFILFAQVRI